MGHITERHRKNLEDDERIVRLYKFFEREQWQPVEAAVAMHHVLSDMREKLGLVLTSFATAPIPEASRPPKPDGAAHYYEPILE